MREIVTCVFTVHYFQIFIKIGPQVILALYRGVRVYDKKIRFKKIIYQLILTGEGIFNRKKNIIDGKKTSGQLTGFTSTYF